MKVEVPEFTRCCFCIPLRFGLLFCSYARLIMSILFLMAMIFLVTYILRMAPRYGVTHSEHGVFNDIEVAYLVCCALIIVLLKIDISFTIYFIIGLHKKNIHTLKIFYTYSKVLLALSMILYIFLAIVDLIPVPYDPTFERRYSPASSLLIVKSSLTSGFVTNVLQFYFIFLLRSEIGKLENNCQFRFMNNAIGNQCAMEICEGNLTGPCNGNALQDNVTVAQDNEKTRDNDKGIENIKQTNRGTVNATAANLYKHLSNAKYDKL